LQQVSNLTGIINELKQQQSKPPPEDWISKQEALQLLNISQPTLYRYIGRGLIGRSKVGGKVHFSKSDCNELITKNFTKHEHTFLHQRRSRSLQDKQPNVSSKPGVISRTSKGVYVIAGK
jgi:excisionase family DNA binding protein